MKLLNDSKRRHHIYLWWREKLHVQSLAFESVLIKKSIDPNHSFSYIYYVILNTFLNLWACFLICQMEVKIVLSFEGFVRGER